MSTKETEINKRIDELSRTDVALEKRLAVIRAEAEAIREEQATIRHELSSLYDAWYRASRGLPE